MGADFIACCVCLDDCDPTWLVWCDQHAGSVCSECIRDCHANGHELEGETA